MNQVYTPDGWGQVLRTDTIRGRTSYLIKGAGFKGWYDSLQVTADFADQPEDIIPNEENETILPYPSKAEGPGKDGTNSTIQPGIDPHLDMGGASESLTGDSTDEDPVEADIEGLFEPHSRLAGARRHRVHFASGDDPVLEVSSLPEESPTGLENSPINPDSVDTDNLFDGSLPHFERESAVVYDELALKDPLAFLKYAEDSYDDDKKKKHHHEQGPGQVGYPKDSDNDDDSDDDDSSSDGGDGASGDSGDGGGDGSDGGGHTAAVALTTTADLHFLANMCHCAEAMPLHSRSEHREILADFSTPPASGTANGVTPQPRDLDNLLERYQQQDNFNYQESNLANLVDHSQDDADAAGNYNHYASVGKQADGYDKYIGENGDGTYHLIASGGGKLSKGEHYGHYESREDAHNAVEAIIARNHAHGSVKTAAPAQQDPGPTQIESQIEQLMQFWAVDNNGWWHWTGSQADLALLNQMQQQMMAVGMPGGPPGQQQMQAQGAVKTSVFEGIVPGSKVRLRFHQPMNESPSYAEEHTFLGMTPEGRARFRADSGDTPEGHYDWDAYKYVDPEYGMPARTDWAYGTSGEPLELIHHEQRHAGFQIEANTPAPWREYLQTVASDKLVALAAWRDVVDKSKRLRSEGAITLEVFKPEVITAYIQGDNGRYYTTVQRLGSVQGVGRQGLTSAQVSGWSCECEWGHWAWLRKRSFVGRMCSHAYALFTEMRSLGAKSRKNKGVPIKVSSVANKAAWTRNTEGGFDWVSSDAMLPTASVIKTAAGWNAQVWSDGTADDSLDLGTFQHSELARRTASRTIIAHVKFAEEGDIDMVGGPTDPYEASDSIAGGYNTDPYSEDGSQEPLLEEEGNPGVQESTTRTGSLTTFAEHDSGDDDEGPEENDDGIEEEEDPDDEDSLDEEVAEDENNTSEGDQDDEPETPDTDIEDSDDDGGHDEPHKRDDEDEGTDNPGDDSDDEGIEKTSSVAELQDKFGLSHLAGANYSLAQQNELVREGEGKSARNRSDLNLTGTHYEAAAASEDSPEDTLSFL